MIYLASQSPRRKELLQQIGIDFQQIHSEIDETPLPDEAPEAYVIRMAKEKALAGWEQLSVDQRPPMPVLAADTSVILRMKILGKPRNEQQACDMLLSLSGNSHEVITAVAVTDGNDLSVKVSKTIVQMTSFDRAVAQAYVATGEPMDKAGAYGIQGKGALLVENMTGSYSGVVGLPLKDTADLLQNLGISPWHS
ncbi:Maf family protein [Endozoicomonas arenosclerae]|uniref:Maf family protein n=1 Tax=Endozoicomonas arenosclerae TaxID=1633495 RepID=UPI00078195DF|nr:Maf family protein [Endozoicomonas arenosclerae]